MFSYYFLNYGEIGFDSISNSDNMLPGKVINLNPFFSVPSLDVQRQLHVTLIILSQPACNFPQNFLHQTWIFLCPQKHNLFQFFSRELRNPSQQSPPHLRFTNQAQKPGMCLGIVDQGDRAKAKKKRKDLIVSEA